MPLLSESRLRQIIIEELVEHYLVQRHLWDDTSDDELSEPQMNTSGQTD